MIEVLRIIASSWPIAIMVVGLGITIVVNRRVKQGMDDTQTLRDIRSEQAVVIRNRDAG